MPNIRELDAPKGLGIQPTEMGIDAAVRAGRTIGANYNEAGSAIAGIGERASGAIQAAGDAAVRYVEHRETMAGAKAFTDLTQNITDEWNKTAKGADPNDPAVAAKFRAEVLEPKLEKMRDSFLTEGGQKFADAKIAGLREHMFEKTSADMASLAAAAVSSNMREMANTTSNTAMTDPSAVPFLLKNVDSDVGTLVGNSPNIKGAVAAKAQIELSEKMKESIVKAGAIGAIRNSSDPEKTADEWGARYPKYINGAELKQLGQEAKRQRNADISTQRWNDHLAKVAREDQSDETEKGYLRKLYSDDPKERASVSAKAIVNDQNLTRTSMERLTRFVDREMKPETDARISARTSADFMRQMRDPNLDEQKVSDALYEARAKDPGDPGSLSKADFADLQKQLIDRKTPQGMALQQDRAEFFKRFAPTIDPTMGDVQSIQFGHHTALGMTKMYEAEKAARRMEEDLKKQGKDPHALYDPSSPDFFGKPANIMKYRASLQDSLTYQKDISKPGAAAPTFTPPPNWQYSPSRQQYRDPSGKVYDVNGKAVK